MKFICLTILLTIIGCGKIKLKSEPIQVKHTLEIDAQTLDSLRELCNTTQGNEEEVNTCLNVLINNTTNQTNKGNKND